jgi:uncharacterized protein YycO
MSLDLSKVQAADIILMMGPSTTSKIIATGTCGTVSHAILVLKNGMCIESIGGSGVGIRKVEPALSTAKTASLYRHKWITPDAMTRVCHHAKQNAGKPYDSLGAVRSGFNTGCSPMRYTPVGIFLTIYHEGEQKGVHDDKFFCSELVAHAFEKANVPLTARAFHEITPAEIMRSDRLQKVDTLIA